MPQVHVENEILIVWASFIGRRPATLRNFKLPRFNECFGTILIFLVNICVPHVEEFHFDVGELSSRISFQLGYQGIKDALD